MIEFIDSYFFGEVSGIPYATLRICLGFIILISLVDFVLSYELMCPIDEGGLLLDRRSSLYGYPNIFKTFNCPYKVFLFLWLICSICIIIGFFSILFLVLLFYLNSSHRAHSRGITGGGDQCCSIVTFWLIFSNPDQCYSITNLLFPDSDIFITTPYAGRGLIANFCLFYCVSVPLKLKGAGWRSGTAVWNVMNFPDRHKWRWPVKFLQNKIWLIKACTYYVLVVEFLTPIGFFVKPLIPIWVFLLFCMHIGIELTMFVGTFGYYMFAFLTFLFLTYLYW